MFVVCFLVAPYGKSASLRGAHLQWEADGWLTVVAATSSKADSSVLIVPFSFLKDILMSLLSFCPSVTLRHPTPQSLHLLCCPHWNCINTIILTLFILLKRENRSVFMKKRLSCWGVTLCCCSILCILTCLLLPPVNVTGFLAVVPSSCEDNAALGKQPFFCCLLIEVAQFQKPQVVEYHKD